MNREEALMAALRYAWTTLSKAERTIDHTTVEWADVATAVHYVGHIIDGRASNLAEAAEVQHQRFLASQDG